MAKPPETEHIMCAQWVDLMDQMNVGAFTINRFRRITAFNLAAQSLFGVAEADVIDKDCREVFSRIPCHAKCPFHTQETFGSGEAEIEILDPNRNRHVITRLAVPLYDSDRAIAGCLTIFQDHSPLADLINRVSYEERTLKIILDNLDIGVFTINKGGHVTFFNTAAELISGFNRREILGRLYTDLLGRHQMKEWAFLTSAMNEGRSHAGRRLEMNTKSGESIPVQADFIPLKNEQGKIVGGLATFQDLTLVQQMDQIMFERFTFHQMIGKSPVMQKIFAMVNVVADTGATVLIEGATGTGKDLLAKVIHFASRRCEKPFVKVNCASLPDNLLESELFGYAKGAFTGASQDKPGRFQEADGGTIVLDEIGDLPFSLQAKLLRVLEDKEFYPLGSRRTVKVDVRIISATNRGLETLVAKGLFREDLFYRLNVLRIELPPLRQRPDDLPLLIRHTLRKLCLTRPGKSLRLTDQAMEILLNHDYPGNVRELENILEHAVIICPDDLIQPGHLPLYLQRGSKAHPEAAQDAASPQYQQERETILEALKKCHWHRGQTAQALAMDRTTLWRKMKKLGIKKSD